MLPYRLAGMFLKVSRGSWVRLRVWGLEQKGKRKGSRGRGGWQDRQLEEDEEEQQQQEQQQQEQQQQDAKCSLTLLALE
ncbi:hypothetical protein TEQG_08664 [Trichophyton equinum CBS 127.97]|uniref:Uncharacterized protein n=1 Tax=Trichophyton equinum (strain ATCC MYA-4606 / CBS 127.97) TaxID=559882 RepID=F2PRY7_TRIEC|nr:hypothetical protein TEQG_08664 [Trichophyton equinum CBS 127.97]